IYLPFMRNAVGPMDFTPGAMLNMQPEVNRGTRPNATGIGTRAYQLALYVVFESGVQMLADNPTLYYRSPDCTEFITSVPTTWDETKALAATVGEIAVVAKRKGDQWFVGGITNGNDLVFRVAVKPTSSTPKEQQTYNTATDSVEAFSVKGRHDLCIALRVPVVLEAVTAVVLADLLLRQKKIN
ncbi:MAG: chorismate synthase, partial [Cytophagaceae bacterium]